MTIEKMREEFNAWFMESPLGWDQGNAAIDLAYAAWQASRAALVIELPKPYEAYSGGVAADDLNGDLVFDAEEIYEAIEAAGAKARVKA